MRHIRFIAENSNPRLLLTRILLFHPRLHPQAKDLVRLLGVYPVGEFQLLGEDEQDASSDEVDAMLEEVMADMEQELRVP